MGKMLADVAELQQELYGSWKRSWGREGRQVCKFCRCNNGTPVKEWHMPDCERLDYLVQHYGVEFYPSEEPYLDVIVYGYERRRSPPGWISLDDQREEV